MWNGLLIVSSVWAVSIECVSHRVALSNDCTGNVDWHLSDLNTFSYDLPNSTHLNDCELTSYTYAIRRWRCNLTQTCTIWFGFSLSTWTLKSHCHLQHYLLLFRWHIDTHWYEDVERAKLRRNFPLFWIFVSFWFTQLRTSHARARVPNGQSATNNRLFLDCLSCRWIAHKHLTFFCMSVVGLGVFAVRARWFDIFTVFNYTLANGAHVNAA